MLKLNLIGKGSVEEGMRKKFKKVGELTEKTENSTKPEGEKPEEVVSEPLQDFSNKTLF